MIYEIEINSFGVAVLTFGKNSIIWKFGTYWHDSKLWFGYWYPDIDFPKRSQEKKRFIIKCSLWLLFWATY